MIFAFHSLTRECVTARHDFARTARVWALSLLVLTTGSAVVRAEEVPRDEYLRQVPLHAPRLVPQTEASREFHLFGDRKDPDYRDEDPMDGIDDGRHEVLMSLAVRFAPFLVQNTADVPVRFGTYIENRPSFPLWIDRWDLSGTSPERVETKGVNLSALGDESCDEVDDTSSWETHPLPTSDARIEDCKMRELLERYSPETQSQRPVRESLVHQSPDYFDVLFLDFPGEGPRNWGQSYRPEYESSSPRRREIFTHAYVHPFLRHVDDTSGAGYELVLQYWFFYPSNDSGMNHEGDWEHLNVVIAPRSRVDRPLSRETVESILDGRLPAAADAADPLVIRRVDYYFHNLVMSLDFSRPNVYLPRAEWQKQVHTQPQTRLQENEIWGAIRNMAYVDDEETRINTHPIGYIGADNKGLNQALSRPGGTNRNPHGTYPFPGRYRDVGPGGTTDQVSVHVDPQRYWRQLEAGRASVGPDFLRGRVLGLADPDRLRLVPDWERVAGLTREDARARREWSWLVLPIRWGYPATVSPFAGILEHFDTGNVAPVGPAFNSGWNVSGPSSGFIAYDPHTLPSIFPLGLQDSFHNELGFLNLTYPVLFNLPPLDFASRLVPYPVKLLFGRRDPVYYPKDKVPFRFAGVSTGVSLQVFDRDFNAMVLAPEQFDEFVTRPVLHIVSSGGDSTTTSTGGSEFFDHAFGEFYQVAFYIGDHFTSENTLRNSRAEFGLDLDFNNIPSYTYRAELNYWEYAGSLRYSISTSRLQPYLKAGYGWSWYRLENVRANGEVFDPAATDWIKPKSIWPNTWHFGLGVEFIPWKRFGKLPGGLDLALRIEYARYVQDLGLDLSQISLDRLGILFDELGDIPGTESVTRDDFLLGATLSF